MGFAVVVVGGGDGANFVVTTMIINLLLMAMDILFRFIATTVRFLLTKDVLDIPASTVMDDKQTKVIIFYLAVLLSSVLF